MAACQVSIKNALNPIKRISGVSDVVAVAAAMPFADINAAKNDVNINNAGVGGASGTVPEQVKKILLQTGGYNARVQFVVNNSNVLVVYNGQFVPLDATALPVADRTIQITTATLGGGTTTSITISGGDVGSDCEISRAAFAGGGAAGGAAAMGNALVGNTAVTGHGGDVLAGDRISIIKSNLYALLYALLHVKNSHYINVTGLNGCTETNSMLSIIECIGYIFGVLVSHERYVANTPCAWGDICRRGAVGNAVALDENTIVLHIIYALQ